MILPQSAVTTTDADLLAESLFVPLRQSTSLKFGAQTGYRSGQLTHFLAQ